MKKIAIGLIGIILVGCTMTPVAPPKTFVEQVYVTTLAVQESEKSLGNLICWPESQPDCIGKPVTVPMGLEAFNKFTEVYSVLGAVKDIQGGGSIVDCAGQQKTATACLATARLILNQVETQYIKRTQ